jgi:phosphocarrier protein FPr/phosphocarrier protein
VSGSTILRAPLAGWSMPIEEAPDEVFAGRMLGDGVAIDPTADTLHAPCDAEVTGIAAARHALTLRTPSGCELLLHVGIDTVGLGGEGFTPLVREGARVRSGEALLSFDLDLIARRAKSLITPVIVTGEGGFRIARRTLGRSVAVGDFLFEVGPAVGAATAPAAGAARELVRRVPVRLEHGLHARPAAQLAAALKELAADVRLAAGGRQANARSTAALMALGVRAGEEVELRASGPDARAALDALERVLSAAPLARAAPSRARPLVAERSASDPAVPGQLRGVIASRGLAVGPAAQLRRPELAVAEDGSGEEHEWEALDGARTALRVRLQRRAAAVAGTVDPGAEIAAAHLALLDDPELVAAARALIAQGKSAGFAWRSAMREQARSLSALEDERLRERADDLLDLETQVLSALAGLAATPPPAVPDGAIIIARDLLPSQLLSLEAARVAGLCAAQGGATSHAAILAAAMGIPALMALGAGVLAVPEGTPLLLDAERGVLEVDPGESRLASARAELTRRTARRVAARAAAQRPGATADGERIEVLANVGSAPEARAAVVNGAEGCGLLRTEFLFLERQAAPDEAEQRRAYQEIADALGARPLTVRTLDAGGDKPIAYLPLPAEENPALGLRGVRTSLAYPELLRVQLRAILTVRASPAPRVLLPMITDIAELESIRALIEELAAELGVSSPVSVGVMIETPASAVLAERFARDADFLSIGTNDLTQYTLAMDRGHPGLAPRLDALHPAVLALIATSAAGARAHGRHAAVCGGLASEPLAAPLLVGLGVNELSAVPAMIPEVKARIAAVTLERCRALAAEARRQESAAAVRALLTREIGAGEEST